MAYVDQEAYKKLPKQAHIGHLKQLVSQSEAVQRLPSARGQVPRLRSMYFVIHLSKGCQPCTHRFAVCSRVYCGCLLPTTPDQYGSSPANSAPTFNCIEA